MFRFISCVVCAWLFAMGVARGAESVPSAPEQSAPALTLRRAVEAALQGNPELQRFAFQFRIQEARAERAGLRPAPYLSLDVENFLGTGEARGLHSAETTLALSQVIELGGKRDTRVNAAQAENGLIDVERQTRQLDIVAEVTRRFIAVASHQEEVRLAAAATRLNEQTVSGAEERVNAARSPHVELDRAQIALSRSRLEERRAESELASARAQLAALWGESRLLLDGQLVGRIDADLFQLPESTELGELVRRLADNPDFLRFATEERVAEAEVRLATTLRKPDLTLSAGVRQLQGTDDQALVASVSVPLFSARYANSQRAEARVRQETIGLEKKVAQLKAIATLQELHQTLRSAVLEAGTLRTEILPRSEEALQETQYAYERGRYSYLELVDAQREYLAVQRALIEASTQAHLLQTEIERLTNAPLGGSAGSGEGR